MVTLALTATPISWWSSIRRRTSVFNYAGLKAYIAGLFDGPVDVVNREGLKPYLRPAVITDAIYAF
jgi:predicted nucleotidyltransferase